MGKVVKGDEQTSISSDEVKERKARVKHRKARSSESQRRHGKRHEKIEKSPGKSPGRSKRRLPSRSASTKPTRPKRGKKEPSEESQDVKMKQKNETKKDEKKNPFKKMNFREFMMDYCEDGASPEDAISAYKVYCEDFAKKELEVFKGTGLFFDLYHPMAQLRMHDWQQRMARMRAKTFVEDLNANKYHGLSLRARRPQTTGSGSISPTCPVAGHLKAPEFAFDANVGGVMISGLPAAISAWDVVEALQDFPGFVTAAWGAPEKELSRTFYASFSDAKAARSAVLGLSEYPDLLSNKGMTTGTSRLSVLEGSVDLSALVLPPEMSARERLEKDKELAAKVIRKMDGLFGIPSDLTDGLLSSQLDTESQLDIQIVYLRRVHHFCFYAGAWCKDSWSLRDSCGPAALREAAPASDSKAAASSWVVGHEKRIHDFLALDMAKDVARPVVFHHQEPKVLERFKEAANQKILKLNDQKFQCQLCNKFFKGQEYVFRHLHRTHLSILDDVREEAHQEISRDAFLADKNHPPVHALIS